VPEQIEHTADQKDTDPEGGIFIAVRNTAAPGVAFGRYIRTYKTPLAVAVHLFGTVVTNLGAWYRRPVLISLGLVIILLAWLRGILWPNKTEEREEAEASLARTEV
jgi:hypothetical protein